jgi:hypothetical protein
MILPYGAYVLFSERDYLLYPGFLAPKLCSEFWHIMQAPPNVPGPAGPLILIYCQFINKQDTMRREATLKLPREKGCANLYYGIHLRNYNIQADENKG